MEPTTLRLPENTLDALDREYTEYDFDNRTEYIRFILDNRGVVMENTEPNTGATTNPLRERVEELERRVDSLESEREQTQTAERRPRTDSRPRDPHPSTSEDTTAESSSGDIGEILAGWPGPREEHQERRREVGTAALDWLRDRGQPASASDFKDALLDDYPVEGQSPDTWYRKSVKPALDLAKDAGGVEYRDGYHDYEWVGE